MAQMSCSEAIRDGIRMEMRRDPNVFLAGEDVGIFGGITKIGRASCRERV